LPLELVMAVEHYNRILHILEEGIPVEMELEVRTTLYGGDPNDHNIIAEIPGTDLAHEIVINAAHFQSEPIGTGAIDNAAGSTTAIEAMRILKAIGVKPRRTVSVWRV
jgi:carboxypeptidase Q